MITGEEQEIISEDAPPSPLLHRRNAKPQHPLLNRRHGRNPNDRGPTAWERLLGLLAEELHLCGEETAVPVVRASLKDTGNEAVIRRYERPSQSGRKKFGGGLGKG